MRAFAFSLALTSLLLLALGGACQALPPEPPTPVPTSGNLSAGRIWVAFTDPEDPVATTFRGGPDTQLAGAIREARLSVDVAIYHLNLWSIRDALIAAHNAGVSVRVVTESDNFDEEELQELIEAGIEVLGDRRESLMHNKFVVIDNVEVWTGSMNFTTTGAYLNNNHLVRIYSSRLAENYTTEFEEMFTLDMFGMDAIENTPNPSLTLDGIRVETYFSPDDDTAARIIELLRLAEKSIYFLVFSFTSDDIAEAMLERASQGVTVAGVFEERQYNFNIGTEFDRLREAGLDVRLDGNRRNMHHKFIVIDRSIVILGSYNFSRNAEERNDENTLVIHSPDLASRFLQEFERVYAQAGDE